MDFSDAADIVNEKQLKKWESDPSQRQSNLRARKEFMLKQARQLRESFHLFYKPHFFIFNSSLFTRINRKYLDKQRSKEDVETV